MNYRERKIKKKFTTFLENAGTEDEREIQELIAQFMSFFNRGEFDRMCQCVTDSAIVDSTIFSKKNIPVKEDFKLLEKAFTGHGGIFWDGITLRGNSQTAVRASGIATIILPRAIRKIGYTQTLVKEASGWKITYIESFAA